MSGLWEIFRKIQILKRFRLWLCKKVWILRTPDSRNMEFAKNLSEAEALNFWGTMIKQ